MCKNQHVRILLERLIGEDLYSYCKKKIGEEEANVLRGILTKEVEEWFNSKSVGFRREDRTALEFAEALVLDKVVLYWLQEYFERQHGIKFILNGCDKINVLINSKVTCEPDFKLYGEEIYIEEITSYTGIMTITGALHLRKSKGDALKKLAEEKEVYILVFEVPTRSYAFIKIDEDAKMCAIDAIPKFGGKSGYGMDIGNIPFRQIEDNSNPVEEMIQQLIGLKNDEVIVDKVRKICGDEVINLHSATGMEQFDQEDGIHYIYSDEEEYPIIKIKIKDGIITKAWDESSED